MPNRAKRRALDVGGQPDKPMPIDKLMEPCNADLNMLLMSIPKEQQNQMKPVMLAMRKAYTAHIDHLHRQLRQMHGSMQLMAKMLSAHDDMVRGTPRRCPGCDFTEEFVLENGCMDNACIEAGKTCQWHDMRKAENETKQAKADSAEPSEGSEADPTETGDA